MRLNNREILAAALCMIILVVFPVLADVAGSISSATDTIITWIRACAAFFIIVCVIAAVRGGGMLAAAGMFVAVVVMVSAREIAAIIQ